MDTHSAIYISKILSKLNNLTFLLLNFYGNETGLYFFDILTKFGFEHLDLETFILFYEIPNNFKHHNNIIYLAPNLKKMKKLKECQINIFLSDFVYKYFEFPEFSLFDNLNENIIHLN